VVDLLRQEDSLVEAVLGCFFFLGLFWQLVDCCFWIFFAGRSSLSGLWRYPWVPFGCKGNKVFVETSWTLKNYFRNLDLDFICSPTVKNGLDRSGLPGKPGRASGEQGEHE